MNNIFEEEKAYLDYAKRRLETEKEYCKKEMREIPRRYTNVLQGDSFLVEGLMSTQATKLRKLELSEKSPYFGRIDFLSDGSNEVAKIYIGKTNISGDNNEQVTIDWRTPICSLYYDSDLGTVSYEAPAGTITGDLKLKRQIIIQDGELVDVLDTSLVSNDELLQPYLSVNADNKMKTIIASIQKEQNQIIRKPISENIVVQGVAGSGKTSVALHRIAYLVYNLGEQIKSNQFLVIGPNKYFLKYISSILPELETEPVDQLTYMDLAIESLKEKLTLEDQNILFNQKSSQNNTKKIQSFKSSLEYKTVLDRFMQDYLSSGIVLAGFAIDGTEIYSAETIKNILFSGINSRPNFDTTCAYFVNRFKDNMEDIYSKINRKYRAIYMSLPKDDPQRQEAIAKSVELSKLVKEKGVKLIHEYFKKIKLSSFNIYKLFIANIDQYQASLSEKEILELQKESILLLKKKKVSFEDLPALMHINYLMNGKNTQYKHIVIDEAQDYGMFHFDVLREIYPNSTFSIYGDLAQSIYSYRSIKDWESVVSYIFNGNCEILNLSKSYRTTIEITENANKILQYMELEQAKPVIRHGGKTTFTESSKDENYKISKLLEWLEKGYKTMAIICKTDVEAKKVYDSLSKQGLNVTQITAKNEDYSGGIFVLTSALSKGLEFDAVMINDASSDVYKTDDVTDMHLLYVASTRALHELDILYGKELCRVFENEQTEKKTSNNSRKLVKKN